MIYDSAGIYVEGGNSLIDKINRIDQVISALLALMIDNAAAAQYKEYQLDDGQTKIRSVYNSPGDIQASLNALEKQKQMYVNRLNGRVFRLRDGRNFNR